MKLLVPSLAASAVPVQAAEPAELAAANSLIIRRFVTGFEKKDPALLSPFLDPEIAFQNYGQAEIKGREAVLALWGKVFQNFATVRFETVHQALNGNIVIEEQIHHLALPGKAPAPIMNMAIYEIRAGLIVAWRDYTDSTYARKLLSGD
ncbi:MAG: nuclear transport factor 2 family protein [Chthoniobacter sp.]